MAPLSANSRTDSDRVRVWLWPRRVDSPLLPGPPVRHPPATTPPSPSPARHLLPAVRRSPVGSRILHSIVCTPGEEPCTAPDIAPIHVAPLSPDWTHS